MKKPFTLLLASLMLVGMTSSVHAQFIEEFSDPAISSQRWEKNLSGGSFVFTKGAVFLKGVGGGYPLSKPSKTRSRPQGIGQFPLAIAIPASGVMGLTFFAGIPALHLSLESIKTKTVNLFRPIMEIY